MFLCRRKIIEKLKMKNKKKREKDVGSAGRTGRSERPGAHLVLWNISFILGESILNTKLHPSGLLIRSSTKKRRHGISRS
jgi:hypothetical protein